MGTLGAGGKGEGAFAWELQLVAGIRVVIVACYPIGDALLALRVSFVALFLVVRCNE